jgi:hypothetical protein
MNQLLQQYIDYIVEPTFKEFEHNPKSMRHAYLACVVAYHAIDRAAYPKRPGALKKIWRSQSFEFVIVDMIAHKFKHIISDDEKAPIPTGHIPLRSLVFGRGTLNPALFNTQPYGVTGIDLYNLSFVVRDLIKFLRQQAA